MKKYIYPKDGNSPPKVVEAEPLCGVDYCDRCGDCLECYQDELCTDDGEHFWVVYEDDAPKQIESKEAEGTSAID